MRSSPSTSCSTSSSSSSSYSHSATGLTLFKKAYELSILCDIEVCVIHYGPDGELKTWPQDREKVKDMALRYTQLDEAKRRKKSINLYGSLKKNKTTICKKNTNVLKYPISDHYTPDQISQLIQSLELAYSTLQERVLFVEAQKQKETNLDHQKRKDTNLDQQKQKETKLDHQGLTPPMSLNLQEHHQTQSLNPSKFSLFMYNHGDATLSQFPLSAASNFHQSASTQFTNYSAVQESGLKDQLMHQELNGFDQNNNFQHLCVSNTQDYSALPTAQVSGLTNQLMQKDLYVYDQNMCLSNINSNNFQHPCVSNTQDYSGLQESVNNYELNQSMQHEIYGNDQNMCVSDITNRNFQHPYELCSDFQDPYSYMVSNTSFPQDMSTSYDVQFGESSQSTSENYSTIISLHHS